MLGTGSRQILVTFYQVPTCQRFSFTPLQGVANLLSAQHARSLTAIARRGTAQWGFAQGSISIRAPPAAQPMLLAQLWVMEELLSPTEGCSSPCAWQEGWRGPTLGAMQQRAVQHSSGQVG